MDMPLSNKGCPSSVSKSLSSNINTKELSPSASSYSCLPINSDLWISWNHSSELLNIAPSVLPHEAQIKVESPALHTMSPPPKIIPANPLTGSPSMIIDTSIDFQEGIEEPLFPSPLPTQQEISSFRGHGIGLPTYDEQSWASSEEMTRHGSSTTSQSQQPHTMFLYATLPSSETADLPAIAMPTQPSSSKSSSPDDSLLSSSSAQGLRPRKRKSSPLTEEDEDETEPLDAEPRPPVKKTAHNMIEKRYRTNLNDKIAALRQSVPSLRVTEKSLNGKVGRREADVMEDLDGLTPANKLNKATILSKATEYIGHLERRNQSLIRENKGLNDRINAFESLIIGRKNSGQRMYPGFSCNTSQ